MARSGPISLNRVKPSKTGLKTISPSPDPARGRRTQPHHALGVAAWMAAAAFLPAAFLSLCTLPILVVMVLVVQDSAPRASFGAPQAVPPAACSWLARRDHVLPHTMQHETLRRTPRPRWSRASLFAVQLHYACSLVGSSRASESEEPQFDSHVNRLGQNQGKCSKPG